eukprot:404279-Rhodomonas_salina.1
MEAAEQTLRNSISVLVGPKSGAVHDDSTYRVGGRGPKNVGLHEATVSMASPKVPKEPCGSLRNEPRHHNALPGAIMTRKQASSDAEVTPVQEVSQVPKTPFWTRRMGGREPKNGDQGLHEAVVSPVTKKVPNEQRSPLRNEQRRHNALPGSILSRKEGPSDVEVALLQEVVLALCPMIKLND